MTRPEDIPEFPDLPDLPGLVDSDEDDDEDGQRPPQPAMSPYAVPLGTLVAGAYVGVSDQIQVQPDVQTPQYGGPGGLDGAADSD